MAKIYYTGWLDRPVTRSGSRITSTGGNRLKKTVSVPSGAHLTFRGRAGKRSNARVVENKDDVRFFEETDDFEVKT
jgi:hypothetical protein